jgi:hypothetical protein
MSNNYFAPNKANNGGAAFFSVRANDGAIYGRFQKQVAWENNKGVFAGGETVSIKFNPSEIAGIARAGKTKGLFEFYHTFDGGSVSGKFSYYKIEPKEQGQKVREGFGWSIKKGDTEFKVAFTLNDAFQLALYAEYALGLYFEADTANDEEEFRKSQEKKRAENNKPAPAAASKPANKTASKPVAKKPAPAPEPEPDDSGSEGEPFEENNGPEGDVF